MNKIILKINEFQRKFRYYFIIIFITYVILDLFGSWVNDLQYYWCKETDLDGIPVVVSRTGWSGEIGYEVYLRDGKRGADLYEKIMAAGEPYKIAPTVPSQIRRVEAGIFSYFQDMRVTDNPYEIGMDRLVDLDMEADFCGKYEYPVA